MSTIITLTTDFGLADAYVAAMKGVILGINPEAKLIDICFLSKILRFFPVFLVVLLLGMVLYEMKRDRDTKTKLDELEAVVITNPEFWRLPVSATFHGRDIFAPVAARLSLGSPPSDFGEAINSLTVLPLTHPYRTSGGILVGRILHIDNFGNLITNIKSMDLPQAKQAMTIEIGNQFISGLSRTYEEGRELLALIGSSGYLEVSLKGGNASTFLGAEVGDEVKIRIDSQ